MAKYELTIHGETGAELAEGVADLMDQFGGGGSTAPAAPKKVKEVKPAPKPEPESADSDTEITKDDVKDAAQRLITALDGDQERAQALVKEAFGVKQVSRLAKKNYVTFVDWVDDTIREIGEATGEEPEEDDED